MRSCRTHLSVALQIAALSLFVADATVAAVEEENFETFSVGALSPQGGWYNPNNTAQDFVVATGINGKSARVHAVADNFFSYSIGRVYAPAFGVMSFSLRAPVTSTYFIFGPVSDPNPNSGFLDPLASIILDNSRALWVYQRDGAGGGYVNAGGTIPENETVRLSWDVRSDGSVWLYRNGRLHFVGQSETLAIVGSPRPIGGIVVGSGNGVVRSDDASRDVLTIDDVTATLPAVNDAAGEVDLALLMTMSHRALGAPVVVDAEPSTGVPQPISFIAINPTATSATGTRFVVDLPEGFTLDAGECAIAQGGGSQWFSSTLNLAAGAHRTCRTLLRRSHAAPAVNTTVSVLLTSTSTDPYTENNLKAAFIRPGLFGYGFE